MDLRRPVRCTHRVSELSKGDLIQAVRALTDLIDEVWGVDGSLADEVDTYGRSSDERVAALRRVEASPEFART